MEWISVFEMFKIGVGPSSSHTMGPWRAAQRFLERLRNGENLEAVARVEVHLYGSLAKTGKGHGTDQAVMLALAGFDPVTIDPTSIGQEVATIRLEKRIILGNSHEISFDPSTDIVFHMELSLPAHPNGMILIAWGDGRVLDEATYFSVGGGFVAEEHDVALSGGESTGSGTADDLSARCRAAGLTMLEYAWQEETKNRLRPEVEAGLSDIWRTMVECVARGCSTTGVLPGGLHVTRRAAGMHQRLLGAAPSWDRSDWLQAIQQESGDFQRILKWVSCFALAVNEENASFGRVVTAPTNGAAGVVPAVLLYAVCFLKIDGRQVSDFLLIASVIGSIFKRGATISAAAGGCQAEIGVSSAMAAAGLVAVQGGSDDQIRMAAEIAMEHHLGLTCDPIGGLVQVPCIERNTMGAIKAITAANIALDSDPELAKVSLDAVVRSMWATAQDMNAKYKETSEGGLATHIPVSIAEC